MSKVTYILRKINYSFYFINFNDDDDDDQADFEYYMLRENF